VVQCYFGVKSGNFHLKIHQTFECHLKISSSTKPFICCARETCSQFVPSKNLKLPICLSQLLESIHIFSQIQVIHQTVFPLNRTFCPLFSCLQDLLQQNLEIEACDTLLQLVCNSSVPLFIMWILYDLSSITLNKCCGALRLLIHSTINSWTINVASCNSSLNKIVIQISPSNLFTYISKLWLHVYKPKIIVTSCPINFLCHKINK